MFKIYKNAPFMAILFGVLLIFAVLQHGVEASPVNINIAASQDVAEALDGVDIILAELIVMQCEIQTCKSPEDIRHLRGLTPELFQSIKHDLRFNVIHRGMDLDDDC